MRKALAVLSFLALLAAPMLLSAGAAFAQDARCLPSELLIARDAVERPSTTIFAHHTGSDAAALVQAINGDVDEEDETPAADEITVLRSAQSDEVLLLGTEEGCLVWRGEMSKSDYEHATWKAFGLPI